MMRCLNKGNIRILDQPPHCFDQKIRRGHVVTVKNGHKLSVRDSHGVINVSRLGMIVLFTLDVTGTDLLGKLLKKRTAAVIENIDMEFIGRPLQI